MEPQKQELQIKIHENDAKGNYSNMMQILHNKEEFFFDFFLNAPPQAQLASRVIMSPGHAKRMALALSENIKKYEEKFGPIKEGEAPEGRIGFVK
jgi:hypothetical protein